MLDWPGNGNWKKGTHLFIFMMSAVLVMSMMVLTGCSGDDDDDDDDDGPFESPVFVDGSREDIWSDFLQDPDPSHYHKYGVYSNRLLTVVHPEVYLRGDSIFLKNIDGRELQPLYGSSATFVLNMDEYDLSALETMTNREFYPEETEIFPFLDRRCLAAKSTLMRSRSGYYPAPQKFIKEIEKGVLYFYTLKKYDPDEAVFLLYAEDESCFVWSEGKMISMQTDTDVSEETVREKNIILIFDDTFVWYPLMERDDTEFDATLAALVAVYGDTTLPALDPVEMYFVSLLKTQSKLDNTQEINLASLLAGKCNYSYGVYKQDASWIEGMAERWLEVLPALKAEDLVSMLGWYTFGSIDSILTKQIILESNVLSPVTWLMASYLPAELEWADLDTLSDVYFYLGFYWGVIWELGFETYSIDESYHCQSGACDMQALNISSVLNLKQVENYFYIGYRGWMGYAHGLVYVPQFMTMFSNGYHEYWGSIFSGSAYPNALFHMSHMGQWAAFVAESFYGNVPPTITADWLETLQQQFGDTIYGNSRQNGDTVDVEFSEFLETMRSQSYQEQAVELTLP